MSSGFDASGQFTESVPGGGPTFLRYSSATNSGALLSPALAGGTLAVNGGLTASGAAALGGDVTVAGRVVFDTTSRPGGSWPTLAANGTGERIQLNQAQTPDAAMQYAIGISPDAYVWTRAWNGHAFCSGGSGAMVTTLRVDNTGTVTIAGPLVATCGDNSTSLSPPVANPASSAGTTNSGQRVLLWKNADAMVDYALGMDGGAMWQSVPGSGVHRQYVGTSKVTETSSAGLKVTGLATAGALYTYNLNGANPPMANPAGSTGTVNSGQKLVVWKQNDGSVDNAIGQMDGSMWLSCATTDTIRQYVGTAQVTETSAAGLAVTGALTASGPVTAPAITTSGLTVSSGGVTAANAVMADRYAFTPNRYGGSGDLASLEVLTRGGESTYLLIQNNNDPDDSIALVATGGVSVNTTVSPGPNQMLVGGGLQVTGAMSIAGANTFEFGQGVAGKDSSAGMIGYGTYSSGASLDIVGAGNGPTRQIKLWAEGGTQVTGGLTVNGPIVNNKYPIPQLSFTLPGGSPSYNDIAMGAVLNLVDLEPANPTTYGNLLGRAFLGLSSPLADMPPITMMRVVFRGVAMGQPGYYGNVVIEAVQGYYGVPGTWNSIQSAMNPAITSQCVVVCEGEGHGFVTAVTPWFTPGPAPGWSTWDVPQIGLRVVSGGALFRFSEITLQFA